MSRRVIVIRDEKWICDFGRGAVGIRSPIDGHRTIVGYSELTGRSWNVLERGQWKKTRDGMVCPGHVRRYIIDRLSTGTPTHTAVRS